MAAMKLFLISAVLTAAHAVPLGFAGPNPGNLQYAPPAYTAEQSNILRTPGNLGQLSTQQKSIQTPYSSVQKTDIRASNDALAYPAGYAAPAPAAYAVPAPAPAAYAQRPAPAAPQGIVGANLLGVAYSPSTSVAHITYNNPNDHVNYAY